MSKYANENVLVISRSLFEELGAFQGFCADADRYLPSILDPRNNFFLSRDEAETDPNYKQIIPYAIFHFGNSILRYRRGGGSGEKRLAAKASIGIGGHVNDTDLHASSLDRDTYWTGFERELEEELQISGRYEHRVAGLINDDSNEVGQVHLGIVHLVTLESDQVEAAEKNITDLEFISLEELRSEKEGLESWSVLCLEPMAQLLGRLPGSRAR